MLIVDNDLIFFFNSYITPSTKCCCYKSHCLWSVLSIYCSCLSSSTWEWTLPSARWLDIVLQVVVIRKIRTHCAASRKDMTYLWDKPHFVCITRESHLSLGWDTYQVHVHVHKRWLICGQINDTFPSVYFLILSWGQVAWQSTWGNIKICHFVPTTWNRNSSRFP